VKHHGHSENSWNIINSGLESHTSENSGNIKIQGIFVENIRHPGNSRNFRHLGNIRRSVNPRGIQNIQTCKNLYILGTPGI
jgi:hypothetical protein